jgi:hypothetical protein
MSDQTVNLAAALGGTPPKKDWNLAIQRMGAGFQGNLSEFDANRSRTQMLEREEKRALKAEEKALSQERTVAAAQDAQIALQYIQAGAPDKALELIDNRIGFINQFGGDPSDTQAVRDLIAANKLEEAASELSLFTTAAESRGLIKPLVTEDERIKREKLDLERADFKMRYGTDAPMPSGQRTAQASGAASGGGMGGGIPSAGGGSFGGTEGAKLRIEQQKAAIERKKAEREQAEFDAKQRDIPEQYLKLYTESSDAERAATQRAAEMTQLAADFEVLPELEAGARGALDEAAKGFFGEQDYITALRERFQATRNSVVVRNLPPGAASDADIALALEGVPGKTATKENIASFLRGQAKIAALDAAYNRFKAGHIEGTRSIRGINEAWRKDAETVFEGVKKEIDRPINRSYTIEAIDAELAKRAGSANGKAK